MNSNDVFATFSFVNYKSNNLYDKLNSGKDQGSLTILVTILGPEYLSTQTQTQTPTLEC